MMLHRVSYTIYIKGSHIHLVILGFTTERILSMTFMMPPPQNLIARIM